MFPTYQQIIIITDFYWIRDRHDDKLMNAHIIKWKTEHSAAEAWLNNKGLSSHVP